jgi:hypothetical protein
MALSLMRNRDLLIGLWVLVFFDSRRFGRRDGKSATASPPRSERDITDKLSLFFLSVRRGGAAWESVEPRWRSKLFGKLPYHTLMPTNRDFVEQALNKAFDGIGR